MLLVIPGSLLLVFASWIITWDLRLPQRLLRKVQIRQTNRYYMSIDKSIYGYYLDKTLVRGILHSLLIGSHPPPPKKNKLWVRVRVDRYIQQPRDPRYRALNYINYMPNSHLPRCKFSSLVCDVVGIAIVLPCSTLQSLG